jgi:hypothetical protein
MAAKAGTEGERRVLAGAPSGEVVDLGDLADDERVVSADVIRRLCVGQEAGSVDPRGLRIKSARVVETLDLSFCIVSHPLRVEATTFVSVPDLSGAYLPTLWMTACSLTGLACDGLRLDGDLCLNSSEIEGEVLLRGARITGNLECVGTKISNKGGDALSADGAEISGGVFLLEPFSAVGTVRFPRSKIHGDLTCRGATFNAENGDALVFDGAEIGGYVFLQGLCATGKVALPGARIDGDVYFGGARLSNEGATLVGQSGGEFADKAAIDGDKAEIRGSVYLDYPFRAKGTVQFVGAKIGGDLYCQGAKLSNERGYALWAEGAEIGRAVDLRNGFNAIGEVRVLGVKIGGDLNCRNAKLVNTRFQIDAGLAKFVNPRFGSLALNAREATIGGSLFIDSVKVEGGVDLYRATSATLVDDLGKDDRPLGSWDEIQPLILDGFAYARFGEDATWSPKLRTRWLKATTDFQQAAWQQLIGVYRTHGLDDEASRAAIAMQDDRMKRAGLPWYRRAGRFVLWAVVGHGYRPWLAGLWAAAIIAAFALAVWQWPGMLVPKQGVHGSPQPAAYAADTFLPIVDLGQADDWQPTKWMRWLDWTVILLGWALTTIFVSGFTRIVRKE